MLAPSVWAVQFLAVYVIAAIHCAKFESVAMAATRLAMAGIAALALLLIVLLGARGLATWRQRVPGSATDSATERERFIAFASFLLAIVSGIATVFGSLPILMFHACE